MDTFTKANIAYPNSTAPVFSPR